MKRLEVSGALRPIYGSLGVKRLIHVFVSIDRHEIIKTVRKAVTM